MTYEDYRIIETRNRREAFDWGLVLASQNIDAIIERSPETGKYIILVPESDYLRAIEQLRIYQVENLHFRPAYRIEIAKNLFDGRSILWAAAMVLIYLIDTESKIDLRAAGIMHKSAVLNGEWWRLFTAVCLHNDLSHLASNITTGFILLGIAIVYYGAGLSILLTFLSGVVGNLTGLFLHTQDYYGLGASGMVTGALGLLAASGWFSVESESPSKIKFSVARLVAAFMLFILIGVNPKSDIQAHLGGFISGLFLGILTTKILKKPSRFYFLNKTAFIVALGLFLFVWWRALR